MVEVSRRSLLQAGATLALAAGPAAAAAPPSFSALEGGHDPIPLWPDAPPGAGADRPVLVVKDQSRSPVQPDRWVSGIAVPRLILCRPARPNGATVILMPGGGYGFLSYDNEGLEQARWLNAQGVTVFVLLYRLPGEGWADRSVVPLQDAQRAVRLVRAGARRYGIDPARVSVIGFSAGGHLAGSIATRFDETVYTPVDAADRLSARPDLVGMIYPVVTMTAATHGGSRANLLGPDPTAQAIARASVEQRVGPDTPPCFIVHAQNDDTVPVVNSLMLGQALVAAKRPGELHMFEEGGHGFGVRLPAAMPASAWPRLFSAYAARKGMFPA